MAQKFPAFAGFAAGIILTLAAGALGTVLFNGTGLSDTPAPTEVIYPNF